MIRLVRGPSAHARLAVISVMYGALVIGGSGVGVAQDLTRFRTPSNRIHCMFVKNEGNAEPNGIACDLDQTVIRTPIRPRPSDCEYDWGQRFELGNDSDSGLECASDWVGSDDSQVLAYGSSIKMGKIVCSSDMTGLICKNVKGHGFFLSRKVQRLF